MIENIKNKKAVKKVNIEAISSKIKLKLKNEKELLFSLINKRKARMN